MNRAYVLFNTLSGNIEEVAKILQQKTGVIMVDIIEDQPAVIIVVQAHSRKRLAELTVKAVASVESITDEVQLLPARSNKNHNAAAQAIFYRRN